MSILYSSLKPNEVHFTKGLTSVKNDREVDMAVGTPGAPQAVETLGAHSTARQKYQKPNSSSCTRGAGHGSKAQTNLVEHVPPSMLECTGSTEPGQV